MIASEDQRGAAGRRRRVNLLNRAGFTFVELIVALAIMIMMAAVVTPVLLGSLDNARVESGEESLRAIIAAIGEFHDDVNRYNRTLSQLVIETTPTDLDLCGSTLPPGLNNKWAGPYLDRQVPATGIPTPIGRIRNELLPATLPSGAPVMLIQIDSVRAIDAVELNEAFDGPDGDNNPLLAGTRNSVYWSAPISGWVTLFYGMPVAKC